MTHARVWLAVPPSRSRAVCRRNLGVALNLTTSGRPIFQAAATTANIVRRIEN